MTTTSHACRWCGSRVLSVPALVDHARRCTLRPGSGWDRHVDTALAIGGKP